MLHHIHMLIVRLGEWLEHVLGGKDRRLQVLVCAADPKRPRRSCRTPPTPWTVCRTGGRPGNQRCVPQTVGLSFGWFSSLGLITHFIHLFHKRS